MLISGVDTPTVLTVGVSNCSCIYGRKVPLKDTEEEMDKLTYFYRKNGFANAADGEHILYDMYQYKSRYEKE